MSDCRVALASAAFALAILILPVGEVAAQTGSAGPAVILTVEGPIGPATAEYLSTGLSEAAKRHARLVILRLDTPGGLLSSTHEMVRSMLAAPMPVVGFVAPGGARAASAGTYLLYAAQIAAMAPATHLGAATPVALGSPLPGLPEPTPEKDKEGKPADGDAMARKSVNDAVAWIRSLAELRGRNADWAEKAVREAASLTATEALGQGAIDLIAADTADLLAKLDGRTVMVGGAPMTVHTAGAVVQSFLPDWRISLLSLLTDPDVAFILMLVGVYGLIFELANPGLIAPGVIGAISLLCAFYALSVLPVSFAGMGLVALGLGFMIAEAFVPSFGVLGLGGIGAFVLGATMLFDAGLPGFGVSWPVIAVTAATTAGLVLITFWLAARAHRRPVSTGTEALLGSVATVVSWAGGEGLVAVGGETWRAVGGRPCRPGQPVRIKQVQGLTLAVEPDNRQIQ
ncbi:MAG: nodulation protein NfeD [Azospirillum sp.]|nr:nodulation protein NfeD [Azospirillum sp.]